ncbi:MAG: hypothetical protein KDJ47_11445 [Hyphomicrobiaceae bacterium]|nr:hypothetical protein [Hyphomicrobiaceae bacterium]
MSGDNASQTSLENGSPRLIERLLAGFEERHQALANRLIQFVAVPLMMWSGLALLKGLPEPGLLAAIPGINWAVVATLFISLAYAVLSWRLGAGIGLACLVLIVIAAFYDSNETLPLWQPAIFFFGLGLVLWLFGRRIEGRPRYLSEMVLDLLMGPAWLIARLLRFLRIDY